MHDPMITDRIPAADHRLPEDGVGCGCGTHAVQRSSHGAGQGDAHGGHVALARAAGGVDHARMKMRGVKTADSVMTTFVRRGTFRSDEARGDRAMALVRDLAAKVRV